MASRLSDNSASIETIYHSRLSSCGIDVFHGAIMSLSTLEPLEPPGTVHSMSNKQTSKASIEHGIYDSHAMQMPFLVSGDTHATEYNSSTQWSSDINFTTSVGNAFPWTTNIMLPATSSNQIVGDHIHHAQPPLTLLVGGCGGEIVSGTLEVGAGAQAHAHTAAFPLAPIYPEAEEWFDTFQSR